MLVDCDVHIGYGALGDPAAFLSSPIGSVSVQMVRLTLPTSIGARIGVIPFVLAGSS